MSLGSPGHPLDVPPADEGPHCGGCDGVEPCGLGMRWCRGARVLELRLCEASRLRLRPGVLYRFSVDPDCPLCVSDAGGTP